MTAEDLTLAQEHMESIGTDPAHGTNTVMVAEALRRGIDVTLSTRSQRRLILSHQGKRYTWWGGRTTLNRRNAKRLVTYKEVVSRVLLNRGINAPENAVFPASDTKRAWAWGESLRPLVVKPRNGIKGRDVFVGIETYEHFAEAFAQVAEKRDSVLVEKFHQGIEHRCLIVDNRLVAATRRRPASVRGDGASTINQLIETKNLNRGLIHKPLLLDRDAERYLTKQGRTPESAPSKGERVFLTAASNIHRGGDAMDATEDLSTNEVEMVERASQQFPGLRLAGFDVLLPRDGLTSEPTILEINANPMTSMHHLPWKGEGRNVSGHVLSAMFPSLGRVDTEGAPP